MARCGVGLLQRRVSEARGFTYMVAKGRQSIRGASGTRGWVHAGGAQTEMVTQTRSARQSCLARGVLRAAIAILYRQGGGGGRAGPVSGIVWRGEVQLGTADMKKEMRGQGEGDTVSQL